MRCIRKWTWIIEFKEAELGQKEKKEMTQELRYSVKITRRLTPRDKFEENQKKESIIKKICQTQSL